MSSSDAYVRVWCDCAGCNEETDIQLPFVYSGVMHAIGHYDHSDEAIAKRAAKEGWVTADGGHFCSPECQALAAADVAEP